MSSISCPNCGSFDLSKSKGGLTSLGLLMMFIGFIFGGGGEGASSFYGGSMKSYLWGIYVLLIGIVLWIFGAILDSKKSVREYECKNCKYKFNS
jgi:DNA-directed RNA polymerase subunit RPC12/RpoP